MNVSLIQYDPNPARAMRESIRGDKPMSAVRKLTIRKPKFAS